MKVSLITSYEVKEIVVYQVHAALKIYEFPLSPDARTENLNPPLLHTPYTYNQGFLVTFLSAYSDFSPECLTNNSNSL